MRQFEDSKFYTEKCYNILIFFKDGESLFLKTLTLNGFKAFANKTVINFEEGICGLIGPNGCGKSNVLDAIKWVVGEQKVTELRSDKMEDVIFHGSELEKNCNMAEVEMVVANENSILPIEFNEISITRRLYRHGESEYLLNRQPCRLRDIQTLFLETGIGKSASSVIEQGRIEKILSLDPESRRFIFEEAGGVVKYRERKKEYERKIEKTQENLVRVSDLIKELKRQQYQAKKQADISQQYFSIQEKLKKEEIDRLLYQLLKHRKNKEMLEKNKQGLIHQIESYQKTLTESNSQLEGIKSEIQNNENHVNLFEKKKIEIEGKLNANKNQVSIFDEQIKEIKESLEERQGELTNFDEEKENLKAKIKTLTKDIRFKQDEHKANQKKLALFEKKVSDLLHQLKTYNQKQGELKKRVETIKKERISLTQKHSIVVDNLIEEIDVLKTKVEEDKKLHSENKHKLLAFQKQFKEKLMIFKIESREQVKVVLDRLKNQKGENTIDELKSIYSNLLSLLETGNHYEQLLKDFLQEDDPFYDLIFSAEGAYAQKEKIDKDLKALHDENDVCEEKIENYIAESKKCQNEISGIKQRLAGIEINQATINQSIALNLRIKDEQVANTNTLKIRYDTAKNYLDRQNSLLKEFIQKKEDSLKVQQQLERENAKLLKDLSSLSLSIKSQVNKMTKNQAKVFRQQQTLDSYISKKEEGVIEIKLLEKDIENLYEQSINRFSENLKEWEKNIINKTFDLEKIKKNIITYNEELKRLRGNVNPLAKDEYRSLTERLNEMFKQQKDVEQSIEEFKRSGKRDRCELVRNFSRHF